eukprot:3050129-Amphidinium_carterae.1
MKGFFVADAAQSPEEASTWLETTAMSHKGWVGGRFNPMKWQGRERGMADATGMTMFKKAADLQLVVGFMPFKGLKQHMREVEALLTASPGTK